MSDTNKASRGDVLLKNASVVLGLLSTLLTVYIASTNYSINRHISQIQAQNLEIDSKLKSLALINANYENAARVVVELGVSNAKEFAMNYKEGTIIVQWPDREVRDQFEQYVEKWSKGNNLMTGESKRGLFLRQVVWLRLTNLGKTPASKLRLEVMQEDFDNESGGSAAPYDEINTAQAGWEKKQINLNDLMESEQEVRKMRTHILIPLAHVSGNYKYFGRVFIPVKVTWQDGRLNKASGIDIVVTNDSELRNSLGSAILGRIR
jgi:hypothetical protein